MSTPTQEYEKHIKNTYSVLMQVNATKRHFRHYDPTEDDDGPRRSSNIHSLARPPARPLMNHMNHRPTLAEDLELAECRLFRRGRFAGMTLEQIARRPNGIAALRFISRGTVGGEPHDSIRRYLATISTNPNE